MSAIGIMVTQCYRIIFWDPDFNIVSGHTLYLLLQSPLAQGRKAESISDVRVCVCFDVDWGYFVRRQKQNKYAHRQYRFYQE